MTLAEAKEFCRVTDSAQDATVAAYVKAAQQHLMEILNRSFTLTEWELALDEFPGDPIQLPVSPLHHVDWIKYFDADGVEQTLDPSVYYVDTDSTPGWVVLVADQSWPETMRGANVVRVHFTAGYDPVEGGSGSDGADELGNVPPQIILAAKMLVSHWNEYREPVIAGTIIADVPMSVQALVAPYRVFL